MDHKDNTDELAVHIESVSFSYRSDDGSGTEMLKPALDDATIRIPEGSYVAILGPNGSGKSTLAKIIDLAAVRIMQIPCLISLYRFDRRHF